MSDDKKLAKKLEELRRIRAAGEPVELPAELMPLSPREAAELLNISRASVRRALAAGTLAAGRDDRGQWQIPRTELDRWNAARLAAEGVASPADGVAKEGGRRVATPVGHVAKRVAKGGGQGVATSDGHVATPPARRRPPRRGGEGGDGPTVQLLAGATDAATDATVELLRGDPLTFDYGVELATVGGGNVYPLDLDSAAYHLGGLIAFEKWDARAAGFRPCDPPAAMVRQLLALGERRRLKPLEAVVTAPTIRRDGSVLDRPGYDAATRLMLDAPPAGLPPVIDRPTIDQARAALKVLLAPFDAFPFVDAAARGALLAALLTAAVRAVLPTSPAFAFDAPTQGAGKTLLASCIGALTEGRAPDVWPHTDTRDDEETRKRLFSALRTGARALIWDNVTGTLDSPSMAGFITGSTVADRVLGQSDVVRFPNRALLILTGNNLSLGGDMPRRVIVCRIDPQTPEPFARQFDLEPLAHCLQHRGTMVAAACTLIRARFTHAAPPAPGRLASFDDWDHLVRQTVTWADAMLEPGGFGDPMDLIRAAQEADPESDALFALLKALQEMFGRHEFGSKEVAAAMNTGTIPDARAAELRAALVDLAGEKAAGTTRGIGRVLTFRVGRITRGLRLASRADSARGTRMFRVMPVETPGSAGTNGNTGFSPTVRAEVSEPDTSHRATETIPPVPLVPEGADPDAYDPEAWR